MVAKAAGQFAGGFFNQPVVLAGIGIIAAIGIPLLIFRKDITDFFGRSFGEAAVEGGVSAIGGAFESAGESITNIFTNITLPSLPSLPSLAEIIPSISGPTAESEGEAVDFTESGMAAARGARGGAGEEPVGDILPTGISFDITPSTGDPIISRTVEEEGIVTVSPIDEFGIGGGPSFEGGVTTFGGGIVDTLTEVLALFPQLTASQARDLLLENPDLTQSTFRLLDPDVLNISNLVEEDQTFLQASDPSFTGLTPEQIAFILTGGNISNF